MLKPPIETEWVGIHSAIYSLSTLKIYVNMKVVITGGHVTPALAVMEKLKEKKPGVKIVFVGRKSTMENDNSPSFEYQLISQIPNVKFINLTTGRVRRFFSFYSLFSLLKIPLGLIQSLFILLKEKPQVILTFGGYLGVPIVLAGWVLQIPIVVHEQTLSLGLANKLIAFFARKVCVSSEANLNLYPKHKTVVTGNPLRKEIWQVNKNSRFNQVTKYDLPVLYFTGGSQGAHFINSLVEKNLADLLKNYVVIHQCGNAHNLADYKTLSSESKKLDEKLQTHYFLASHIFPQDLGTVYKLADLVIGRSGANTIWELLALNKKAILIPLPFGQKEDQQKNAEFLQKTGLAKILEQDKFINQEFLAAISQRLKKKDSGQARMTDTEKDVILKNASEKVVQEVLNVAF